MAVQKNMKKDAPVVQEVKAVEAAEAKKTVAAPEVKVEAPVVETKAAAPAEAKKTTKTTAAKKTAKAAAPAAEKMEEIFIQYSTMEWKASELMERAKAAYAAEGHRASSIKSVNLYVKPEERKAYYVINEKTTGSIDL